MKYFKRLPATSSRRNRDQGQYRCIGQDVFENPITLSFTGGTGDTDVIHAPVIHVQCWIVANWLKPITADVDAMPVKRDTEFRH